MRELYMGAIERKKAEIEKLLDEMVVSRKPSTAVAVHELAGKLNKELGHSDAASKVKPVTYNFFTNLNPMALAGRRIVNGEARQVEGATNGRTPPALPADLPAGAPSARRSARTPRRQAT
jgi:hypothetical protein